MPRQGSDPTVVALGAWRLQRKHILMLVLAIAVLVMGAKRAEFYYPPGTAVNLPSTLGHAIT